MNQSARSETPTQGSVEPGEPTHPVRPFADDEIDLMDLILPLVEHRRQIAALTLLAGLLAALVSMFMPPRYEAQARLRIVPVSGVVDVSWAETPPVSYADMPDNPSFEDGVAQELSLVDAGPGWMQDRVDVAVDEKAGHVTVTARAADPEDARALADAVAAALRLRAGEVNRASLTSALRRELSRLQAQAEATRAELNGTEPYLWVQEALTDDAVRLSALLRQAGADADLTESLREAGAVLMVRQVVNPVWQTLSQRVADLESRRAYLADVLQGIEASAAEEYTSLESLYPARAPTAPTAPRTALNVIVGSMLGGMLSVFWVFFRRMWRQSLSSRDAALSSR